jgi:hypothetical protein
MSFSKSSTCRSSRGSVRTVVGVEGPGVAGVEAVVMMGERACAFCSGVLDMDATSMICAFQPASHHGGCRMVTNIQGGLTFRLRLVTNGVGYFVCWL